MSINSRRLKGEERAVSTNLAQELSLSRRGSACVRGKQGSCVRENEIWTDGWMDGRTDGCGPENKGVNKKSLVSDSAAVHWVIDSPARDVRHRGCFKRDDAATCRQSTTQTSSSAMP